MPWIKPDLVAPSGRGASSLATAAVAGLIACLKERFPSVCRRDLLRALRTTASNGSASNKNISYGVPLGSRALDLLIRPGLTGGPNP